MEFSGNIHLIEEISSQSFRCTDIRALNTIFIEYLNYGGYPEAVFNEEVRKNPDRFIRSDIVEKVLLNDLPSLYGINNIQELKKLFMFLAYNAGHEASYEGISQESGISKTIVRTYLEYLESAFLVIKLPTVNETCRSMQRERNFKVYLSNPSMRAALFTVAKETENALIGHLAESAVFSQWQHSLAFSSLRYARWRTGEVDVVFLSEAVQKARWAGEIKWSDRIATNPDNELRHLRMLLSKQPKMKNAFFTTKTISMDPIVIEGRSVSISPTSLYCYTVGRNAASSANKFRFLGSNEDDEDSEE